MKPEFDFDQIIDRRPTASFKWDLYKGKDILPMWVADMDFRSPPEVIEALKNRLDHGVFGYTHPPAELNEAALMMLESRYQWRVDEKSIVWLPGLVTGLNAACRAVGKTGDNVVTATPVYPPFLTAPGFADRKLVTVDLQKKGDRWAFDFDRLDSALADRTSLLILCSPHNPVGRVYTRRELKQLAALCRRHDVIICSDEIHCDLILDENKRHIPTAALSAEIAERTITLMAPSKTYNLPGLGCSFAVITNQKVRRKFKQATAGIVPHVNVMGLVAANAAYRYGDKWLTALLDYLRGNRDLALEKIDRMPQVTVTPVEATYLAWIDCRRLKLENPAQFFEQAGVGLSNGSEFGGPGYVRLNFGCPRSILDKALQRMTVALESFGET